MFKQIITKIKKAPKIALFHHIRPDGDSISCSYGLGQALKSRFPDKEIVWLPDQDYLAKNFAFLDFSKLNSVKEIDESYLAIMGDSSSAGLIQNYDQFQKGGYRIIFDHHENDVNADHDLFWHEPTYGASAMQAFMIAKELNAIANEDVAFYLMIGLLTDTGNFTYTTGDHRPPKMYSELLELIPNQRMDDFFNDFKKRKASDIELVKMILENLKLSDGVAYIKLDRQIVETYGADQIHRKIHTFSNIEGFPIWVQFLEEVIKERVLWVVHMRSSGPNVSKVATKHGGGGHVRAAATRVQSQEETKIILKELQNLAKSYSKSSS